MRGSPEEVAELAERVRPDRLLLVCPGPEAVEALVLEHVEVAKPEADHHLLELARRLYGADQAGLASLLHDGLGALARGFLGLRVWLLAGHPRRLELPEQLDGLHAQCLQLPQPPHDVGRLGNALGMKLRIDVAIGPDLLD